MVGLGWVGKITLSTVVRLYRCYPFFMFCLHSESMVHPLLFCSYIANQKRLEIINEDDVEAYVGLKNL